MDTAFTFVAGRAWAPLFAIVGFTLVVANFGSGMGAQLGAARLLYGMGRSNALPKSFFGVVDPKRRVPRNNVLFVGGLALAGAFLLPALAGATTGYDLGANLLNFGALIAFMGVNAAAFVRYYLHEDQKKLSNLLPPVLGFIICFLLWISLSPESPRLRRDLDGGRNCGRRMEDERFPRKLSGLRTASGRSLKGNHNVSEAVSTEVRGLTHKIKPRLGVGCPLGRNNAPCPGAGEICAYSACDRVATLTSFIVMLPSLSRSETPILSFVLHFAQRFRFS